MKCKKCEKPISDYHKGWWNEGLCLDCSNKVAEKESKKIKVPKGDLEI